MKIGNLFLALILVPIGFLIFTIASLLQFDLTIYEPVESVIQVDLIDYSTEDFDVLYTLSDAEIPDFMAKLTKLKCHKHLNPQEGFGDLVIRLTFSTGNMQLLGTGGIGYGSGTIYSDGWYYMSTKDMEHLFADYIAPELLPGYSAPE